MLVCYYLNSIALDKYFQFKIFKRITKRKESELQAYKSL